MNKRVLSIAIVVVVIAVGIFMWRNLSSKSPNQNSETTTQTGANSVKTNVTETSSVTPKSSAPTAPNPVVKKSYTPTTVTNTNPGNVTPDLPRAQVTYTDTGFTSISAKKGQTVRFMNLGSKSMLVISDTAPISYAQTAPLIRGEYFDFVFYTAGTWKFHNQLDPTKTGSVRID